MKRIIWILLLCLFLTACGYSETHASNVTALTGLDITGSTIISEKDSHGGFLGDGELIVVFDCSEIADSLAEQTKSWRRLPLSENLQLMMYGGTRDGGIYSYNKAEENGIPELSNGCYFFINRQVSEDEAHDDAALFDGASFNFSLFLYDEDACRLYYYELDT